MSQQIIPQVDVAGATLQGFASFTPILAALSADNVTPMAMVEMENLGALFHINGGYAAKVSDLLQRSTSVRLSRLGLAVGWRKGDAASYLAQSAGGQAIALLSMCLNSLYQISGEAGKILHTLASRLLPSSISIASVAQLEDVAKVAGAKLDTFGFGNQLARQVIRIYDIYKHLGESAPADLLEELSSYSTIGLFLFISRIREEGVVVRITGTKGMCYIITLMIVLFPEDLFVTVENVVVQEGLRKSVLIEIGCGIHDSGETHINVEKVLRRDTDQIPLHLVTSRRIFGFPTHCFNWRGWVADCLELEFMTTGSKCPEAVLTACCDLLVQVFNELSISTPVPSERDRVPGKYMGALPKDGVTRHLGAYQYDRISQVCQLVWHTVPTLLDSETRLHEAMEHLEVTVDRPISNLKCGCLNYACKEDESKGGWGIVFKEANHSSRECNRR